MIALFADCDTDIPLSSDNKYSLPSPVDIRLMVIMITIVLPKILVLLIISPILILLLLAVTGTLGECDEVFISTPIVLLLLNTIDANEETDELTIGTTLTSKLLKDLMHAFCHPLQPLPLGLHTFHRPFPTSNQGKI